MKKKDFNNNEEEIFCFYCKDRIEKDKAYVIKNGQCYHLDCWKQMNTFNDPFLDETIYVEE